MQCLWLCFNTSAVRWDMAARSGYPAKPEVFTKCLLISPQSNVHRYTDKILSVNTYCSFLQSCKETTHGSIKKSMDVHTAVTPCHGFLHSNKKEWIINMYNIRESNPLHRVEGGRQKTALTECFLLDKVTENGKWSIMTKSKSGAAWRWAVQQREIVAGGEEEGCCVCSLLWLWNSFQQTEGVQVIAGQLYSDEPFKIQTLLSSLSITPQTLLPLSWQKARKSWRAWTVAAGASVFNPKGTELV